MNYFLHSPEDTRAFGAALSRQLAGNDVLLLYGDLGAGKSELTRGIAAGLGTPGYITSPTFTILQVHEGGRLPLYHFDWYRLNGAEELYELNLDEYLRMDGISVVEWPQRAEEVIPEAYLRIDIDVTGENERVIRLTPTGGFRALQSVVWKEEKQE